MTPRHALSLVASLLLAAACDDATTCATSADCFQGELCSAEGKCRELMADMSGPDLATDMDSPDLPPDMAQDMAQDMAPDLEPDLPPDMEPDLEPDLPPDMDSAGCQGVMCGPGTCVASDNGVARCSCPAGYDDSNPLRCRPIPTHIAAGDRHTCAIAAGKLYCWGDNNKGQLGLGDVQRRNAPTPVPGMDSDVTAVAAGAQHTCAIKGSFLYCWGDHASGQLGIGSASPTPLTSPQRVMGMDPTLLTAGEAHTCAVFRGNVHCWGDNSYGKLGLSDAGGRRDTPQQLTSVLTGATHLSAGADHTCAIASAQVYCWGAGANGRLGNDQFNDLDAPTMIIQSATSIGAGAEHTCAIVAGDLLCWGSNLKDQIGAANTPTPGSATPKLVLGDNTTLLAVGAQHACALQSGTLYCWGANERSQCAQDASSTTIPLPTIIAGLTPTALAAGSKHTCAITNQQIACWGDNTSGQLGLGLSTAIEASPSAVNLP